jgi:hypothetical protein
MTIHIEVNIGAKGQRRRDVFLDRAGSLRQDERAEEFIQASQVAQVPRSPPGDSCLPQGAS